MNRRHAVFRSFLYRSSLFLTVTLMLFFLYALLPEDLKIASIIAASAPDLTMFEVMALEEPGFFSLFRQLLSNPSLWEDFFYHALASARLSLSALPLILIVAGILRFSRQGFRNFRLIALGISSVPAFFAALLLSSLPAPVSLSAALILALSIISAIYRGPAQWYPLSFSFTATLLALELVFGIEGLGWWMHRSAMRLDLMPLILVVLAVSAGICLYRFITELYVPGSSQRSFPKQRAVFRPAVMLLLILSAAALSSLIPGAGHPFTRGALIVLLSSIPAAAAAMAVGLLLGFPVRYFGTRGRHVSIWISDVMLSVPPVPVAALLFVLSGGSGQGLFFLLIIAIGWPRYFKYSLKDYRFREVLPLFLHHTGDLILLVSLLAFAGVPGGAVNYHWGGMMSEARNWSGLIPADNAAFIATVLLPGTAIFLTVFCCHLTGRALAFRKKITAETAQSGEPW
jgi:hypothetical protein